MVKYISEKEINVSISVKECLNKLTGNRRHWLAKDMQTVWDDDKFKLVFKITSQGIVDLSKLLDVEGLEHMTKADWDVRAKQTMTEVNDSVNIKKDLIELLPRLSKAALTVLADLQLRMQYNVLLVKLEMSESTLRSSAFYKGVKELSDLGICGKSRYKDHFWIHPRFMSKGGHVLAIAKLLNAEFGKEGVKNAIQEIIKEKLSKVKHLKYENLPQIQ